MVFDHAIVIGYRACSILILYWDNSPSNILGFSVVAVLHPDLLIMKIERPSHLSKSDLAAVDMPPNLVNLLF